MKKQFHLGDVLSVTGKKLVSPRLIDGIYDILNYMTGDNLFTHQLISAQKECRPFLLRQFPQLAEVDESSVNRDTWRAWLDEQIAKFGEFLDVEPLPEGAHRHRDPVEELMELRPDAPIITVKV